MSTRESHVPGYYGGAPTAFQGGMEFGAAQRRRMLYDNALNALIQKYGPEAAAPVEATQLEALDQSRQTFPYDLKDRQRTDAARDEAVRRGGPIAGDAAAMRADAERETRLRNAGLAAARALQLVKQRGGDLGAAYDRLMPILPALGFPSEQLAALKQQILANPDMVDELAALFAAGDQQAVSNRLFQTRAVTLPDGSFALARIMSDGTAEIMRDQQGNPIRPADQELAAGRLAQGGRRLTLQEQQAMGYDAPPGTQLYWTGVPGNSEIVARLIPGTEQEIEQDAAVAERIGEVASSMASLEVTGTLANEATTEIDEALELIERAGGFGSQNVLAALQRGAAAQIPGTDAYEIRTLLESIGSRNMLEALQNIDGSLMPVSDTDAAALRASLGVLRVTRDPQRLRETLQRIRTLYQRAAANTAANRARAQQELQGLQDRRNSLTASPVPAPGSASDADYSSMSEDELWRIFNGAQ